MPSDPREILHRVFGFESFRGRQEEVIDHLCGGGDALLVMPTGGGKSLCYQLPALLRPGLGVVVSPLIALMHDQVTALRQKGVRAAYLNSSLSPPEAREVRARMDSGELDLLYVAPERLVMEGFLKVLDGLELALFAIDEAHCVSAWGHDFRPEYLQLSVLKDRYPSIPRLALTATADPDTRAEIIKRLHLAAGAEFVAGFDRPNLRYSVSPKGKQYKRDLLEFIRGQHPGESGIVYRLTRKSVDELAAWLQEYGVNAIPYHAGLDDDARRAHQDRFLAEPGLVIVATIAFGMGVDKPDVRFVAHLDMPKSLEDYHQQTGRGGRDGQPADAWMLFGAGDLVKLRHFINSGEGGPEFKGLERKRLRDMERFCTTTRCRRQVLLEHFGETYPRPCGNCDVCGAGPPAQPKVFPETSITTVESPVAGRPAGNGDLLLALACVLETGQGFGYGYLSLVLAGQETSRVKANRHASLQCFGRGKDRTQEEWQGVFTRMVDDDYLVLDPENRGHVLVGPRAAELLLAQGPAPTPSAPPVEPPSGPRPRRPRRPALTAEDKTLYETLRELRSDFAAEERVPHFMVISNEALREMALHRPRSQAEMLEIKGVGPVKWAKYGAAFLAAIKSSMDDA